MVLDFGAHLYPESVFPEPIASSPLADTIGSLLTDPAALCRLYDRAGIDEAVLSQPFYMGHSDADRVAVANDALLDVVADFDRFFGLAAVPTAAGGDAAAGEFERALDAGYHGGALETASSGIELTDPEVEPVFEVADRRDVPLLVHPKLDESLHPDVLDDRYLLNAIFGREAALAESVSTVIHTGVLESYPNLSLVYHHLGGNLPSMIGRVALQLDDGRWPGQDHVVPFDRFSELLSSRIYLDTSGFFGFEHPLEAACSTVPPSQLLFGTDYPFEPRSATDLATMRETVESVAGVDAPAILADNAHSLLTES